MVEEIAADFKGKVQFVAIDIKNNALPGITPKDAGIVVLPTYTWAFNPGQMGKPVTAADKENIRKRINTALGMNAKAQGAKEEAAQPAKNKRSRRK